MRSFIRSSSLLLCVALIAPLDSWGLGAGNNAATAGETETLNVLFIGNSYTGRHNLAQIVKAMAQTGHPQLTFKPTTITYGGRRLVDHWRLGTQNVVQLHSLSRSAQEATIASLQAAVKDNPDDRYAKGALKRHRQLLDELESKRTKWDAIVLQSYRDDLEGENSLYAQFAPRFAELAQAQGARVILYETTPTTQNAQPLTTPPDPTPILNKARQIAALAERIGASAAPMSLVALRCQLKRPDLTLRFINDAHLNQTMAYLTACTLYAALFQRSPEGLAIDSVTDIRFFNNDSANRDKDRDGNPITRKFSEQDRADLQRIAWQSYNEFQKLRPSPDSPSAVER